MGNLKNMRPVKTRSLAPVREEFVQKALFLGLRWVEDTGVLSLYFKDTNFSAFFAAMQFIEFIHCEGMWWHIHQPGATPEIPVKPDRNDPGKDYFMVNLTAVPVVNGISPVVSEPRQNMASRPKNGVAVYYWGENHGRIINHKQGGAGCQKITSR